MSVWEEMKSELNFLHLAGLYSQTVRGSPHKISNPINGT